MRWSVLPGRGEVSSVVGCSAVASAEVEEVSSSGIPAPEGELLVLGVWSSAAMRTAEIVLFEPPCCCC